MQNVDSLRRGARPYQDAPGMSFVLYLFMLDEVGTSGVCGEEGIFVEQT
jgi:hypothetical protein